MWWKSGIVSEYLPPMTQTRSLSSWCSSLMYNGTSSGVFFLLLIFWFYLKTNLINKNFVSINQIFKPLLPLQKLWDLSHNDVISNCMPSNWLKQPTVKYHTWNFSDFLTQWVTKIMKKLLFGQFLVSPRPPAPSPTPYQY